MIRGWNSFEKWKLKKKKDINGKDILSINNKIQDLEIQVEILIFKIYNLSKIEIETVLESLKTIKNIKNRILSSFK